MEFSGHTIEFGVGVVRGYRSFDYDITGRLFAPVYGDEWESGENVARCHKRRGPWGANNGHGALVSPSIQSMTVIRGEYRLHSGVYDYSEFVGPVYSWYGPDRRLVDYSKPASGYGRFQSEVHGCATHSVYDCTCGFFAYTDGSSSWPKYDNVIAAVEGYGEVIAGTRGFRAQRAKIVALVLRPVYPVGYIHGAISLVGWAEAYKAILHRWVHVPHYPTVSACRADWPCDLAEGI